MRPVGYRTETKQRPFALQDPDRKVNEFAVIQTEPRKVVMVGSFSNPQARIFFEEYRFMWFEGELLLEAGPNLVHPLANPRLRMNAIAVLADTGAAIDEAVLVKGQDQQIANFSFRDRWLTLHRPDFHLEWTEGVSIAQAVAGGDKQKILGPEALG